MAAANCIFQYKCDNFYSKEHEGGVLFSDPDLGIDWGIDLDTAIVSDKDKVQPTFQNLVSNFEI